jgi:hypothetical protein
MRKTEKSAVWRGHQPNVAKDFVHPQPLFTRIVERFYHSFVASPFRGGAQYLVAAACGNGIGDILHAPHDAHFESGVGKLFAARHRPKTVGQIVVLDGAVFHYLVVAAVVVGEEQPLGRNDSAGASAAKHHDRVVERWTFGIIEIRGFESKPFFAHIFHLTLDLRGQPHSLISK